MNLLIDRLLLHKNKPSTNKTYLAVWQKFNTFLIRLDFMPSNWEDRVQMFIADMIQHGAQSSTCKSYISVIKRILFDDGYQWNDNLVLLAALTKACRAINDRVKTRLLIGYGLLELILFKVSRVFILESTQPYLCVLYQAIFTVGYYGLM